MAINWSYAHHRNSPMVLESSILKLVLLNNWNESPVRSHTDTKLVSKSKDLCDLQPRVKPCSALSKVLRTFWGNFEPCYNQMGPRDTKHPRGCKKETLVCRTRFRRKENVKPWLKTPSLPWGNSLCVGFSLHEHLVLNPELTHMQRNRSQISKHSASARNSLRSISTHECATWTAEKSNKQAQKQILCHLCVFVKRKNKILTTATVICWP